MKSLFKAVIVVTSQVAVMGLVTLSRWRHGFEPRWGCKVFPGQGLMALTPPRPHRASIARTERRHGRERRQAGERGRDGSVPFLGGVLVDEGRLRARVADAPHHLFRAGPRRSRERRSQVAQVVEAIADPHTAASLRRLNVLVTTRPPIRVLWVPNTRLQP